MALYAVKAAIQFLFADDEFSDKFVCIQHPQNKRVFNTATMQSGPVSDGKARHNIARTPVSARGILSHLRSR